MNKVVKIINCNFIFIFYIGDTENVPFWDSREITDHSGELIIALHNISIARQQYCFIYFIGFMRCKYWFCIELSKSVEQHYTLYFCYLCIYNLYVIISEYILFLYLPSVI